MTERAQFRSSKLLLIETWRLIPIAPFERTNNLSSWEKSLKRKKSTIISDRKAERKGFLDPWRTIVDPNSYYGRSTEAKLFLDDRLMAPRGRRRVPRRNNTHRRTLRSLMLNETPPRPSIHRDTRRGWTPPPKETLSCAIPADFIAARPHHSVAKETVAEGGEGKKKGKDIEIFNLV